MTSLHVHLLTGILKLSILEEFYCVFTVSVGNLLQLSRYELLPGQVYSFDLHPAGIYWTK